MVSLTRVPHRTVPLPRPQPTAAKSSPATSRSRGPNASVFDHGYKAAPLAPMFVFTLANCSRPTNLAPTPRSDRGVRRRREGNLDYAIICANGGALNPLQARGLVAAGVLTGLTACATGIPRCRGGALLSPRASVASGARDASGIHVLSSVPARPSRARFEARSRSLARTRCWNLLSRAR
jgi:hypothetical protein